MRTHRKGAALVLVWILLIVCSFDAVISPALADEKYVTVRVGSRGDLVWSIKSMLTGLGYDPGENGDLYDSDTKAAVISFQKDMGLKADGIAGAQTQKALNEAYSMMLPQGRELTAWVQSFLKSSGAACGTVMVSKNGNPLMAWSFGGVDGDTCFRIASVTKWVTAIGLMTLYDEGKLDLDEDISTYLPFQVRNPAWKDAPITARMLLTHTSSLSPEATDYKVNWARIGVKGYDPIFLEDVTPGTKYTYADFDGALFGALIEAIAGESVQQYLDRMVFKPLGITAAYTPSLLPKGTKTQSLLSPKGKTQISVQRDINRGYNNKADPEGNLGYTVGRLYINASGLTKLAQMMLSGGALNGVRILKESTVALMEADQPSVAPSPYGLSTIRLNDYPRGTWYGHQGRYSGLTSNVYYQRETGLTAVLILDGYDYTLINNIVTPADTLLRSAEQIEEMHP